MLLAKPPAKPDRCVSIDESISRCNRTKLEVVGPAAQFLIQQLHHLSGIQPSHISACLDTHSFSHALDTLPRWASGDVRPPGLGRIAPTKCVPQEIEPERIRDRLANHAKEREAGHTPPSGIEQRILSLASLLRFLGETIQSAKWIQNQLALRIFFWILEIYKAEVEEEAGTLQITDQLQVPGRGNTNVRRLARVSERSDSRIVTKLADEVCKRIARRIIKEFQQRKDVLLSGDDSCLTNTWEELCVQVQQEQSFYWDMYIADLQRSLAAEVEQLQPYEREAVWLQTPAGGDCDDEEFREPEPFIGEEEIVEYLTNEYVLAEAGRWSNRRIRKYLDRAGRID